MSLPPYPDEPTLAEEFAQDYREAGQSATDVLAGVWQSRTVYDHCAGMTLEASTHKHRQELRAQLGLTPLPDGSPLPADPRQWRGNYLANGFEPWGFNYPGWDSDRRNAFRTAYRAAGYTHLPMAPWGHYGGDPRFQCSPEVFQGRCDELRGVGIEPCVFVVTDAVSPETRITPANADAYVRFYLPQLNGVRLACLGWELNQVDTWGTDASGHDMIALARSIKGVWPDVTLYAHFQPHWWGPHYRAGDERHWWRDAPEVDGLLYQAAYDAPEADELDVAFHLPGGSHHGGIVGRMVEELGRQCVLFEHSREPARWERFRQATAHDGRCHGWC